MPPDSHVEYEMTISHKDFLRTVHGVLEDVPHTVMDTTVEAKWPDRSLTIRLSPEGQRELGPMELPVTMVSLDFQGFSEEQQAQFLESFREHYQSTGGP